MSSESEPSPQPESKETDPILEMIALHFEREAVGWLTEPEKYHPLSSAIENGTFGTEEERRLAVNHDAQLVADLDMEIAAEVRQGNTARAKDYLQLEAARSKEAVELLKALDPEARPRYKDADKNGDRVVVGRRYRWTPEPDNQGNEAGYNLEGVVTAVSRDGFATALWYPVGKANPAYWGRGETELVRPTHATMTFAKMLEPIEGSNQ